MYTVYIYRYVYINECNISHTVAKGTITGTITHLPYKITWVTTYVSTCCSTCAKTCSIVSPCMVCMATCNRDKKRMSSSLDLAWLDWRHGMPASAQPAKVGGREARSPEHDLLVTYVLSAYSSSVSRWNALIYHVSYPPIYSIFTFVSNAMPRLKRADRTR